MTTNYKIFSIEDLLGNRNAINEQLQSAFPDADIVVPSAIRVMPEYLKVMNAKIAEGLNSSPLIAYRPKKLIVPNKKELRIIDRNGKSEFDLTAELSSVAFIRIKDITDMVNDPLKFYNLRLAAELYCGGGVSPAVIGEQRLDSNGFLSIFYLDKLQLTKK